jgi:hypothetical protein
MSAAYIAHCLHAGQAEHGQIIFIFSEDYSGCGFGFAAQFIEPDYGDAVSHGRNSFTIHDGDAKVEAARVARGQGG